MTIKKTLGLIILTSLWFTSFSQTTEQKTRSGRPDIPGTFALEIGVNRMTEKPNNLKYGLWGSRTLNVYYQYDIRIAKSKFSFHPGIGFGMERFKLMNYDMEFSASGGNEKVVNFLNPTLGYDANGNTIFIPSDNYINDDDTLGQINWSGSFNVKKSMLVTNFIDVPLEFRFSTKPDDPARSFKIGIGGRIGYLLNAHTKIRYKEDGDIKKLKEHESFNLTKVRYSASLKVYFGNFGFFSYYNVNPLFESNKGPDKTDAKTFTIGISLTSF